jgi:hypothetical protein
MEEIVVGESCAVIEEESNFRKGVQAFRLEKPKNHRLGFFYRVSGIDPQKLLRSGSIREEV